MERWKGGRMEGMERWKDGDGKDGEMERWKGGRMEGMERWKDGLMEGLSNLF